MKKLSIVFAVAALAATAALALDDVAVPKDFYIRSTGATTLDERVAVLEATGVGGALESGKIIVGNSGGTGAAVTVTGDFSLSNTGVATVDGAAGDFAAGGNVTAATNITATAGNIQATAGTLLTGVGLDAVGAVDMDYGSADVTDHTFITDGTGDSEIVLPAQSIGEAEIVQTAWAQSDTNSTTDLAAYTPQHVGDILIGLQGDTNWVWIARGTTTNDWQQVAP